MLATKSNIILHLRNMSEHHFVQRDSEWIAVRVMQWHMLKSTCSGDVSTESHRQQIISTDDSMIASGWIRGKISIRAASPQPASQPVSQPANRQPASPWIVMFVCSHVLV
jgi:hypothetical protein